MRASLAASLLALSLAGCAIASTREETATRDLQLYVDITSTNAGTHVDATLRGPFGGFELGPDDSFTLALSGAPVATASGAGAFALDLPARSGDFAFALHHAGDHDVTSTVPLAAPSGLSVVVSGGQVIATWTPSTLASTVTTTLGVSPSVSGACVSTLTIPILTDTGSYTIPAAQLQPSPLACSITITLVRSLQIQTDPFGDPAPFMFAQSTQTESVQVPWTP